MFIRTREYSEPAYSSVIPGEAEKIVHQTKTRVLDEYQAKKVLRAYGIPTTTERLVQSFDEALDSAGIIGYPVALKVCSSEVTHKTDSGMIFLDIKDSEALKRAYRSLREKDGDSDILVSEMLKGDREFMAGMNYFPGFPPCIMFGIGGVFAEALSDFTIRIAPLGRYDAYEMIQSISARAIVGPYRNMQPVDLEATSRLLISLGQLSHDLPRIKEIDLNPIIVVEGQPKVADALMIIE